MVPQPPTMDKGTKNGSKISRIVAANDSLRVVKP